MRFGPRALRLAQAPVTGSVIQERRRLSGRIAETAFDLNINRFKSSVLALDAAVSQGF
jgi:hypothetical protein